jgi:integrase
MKPAKITPDHLKNKTNRAKLDVAPKPYWFALSVGLFIGYRRCQGPGRWTVRDAAGVVTTFALADDRDEANGVQVMNWEQAQIEARRRVRGGDEQGIKTILLEDALATYKADLIARSAGTANAMTIYRHLKRVAPQLLRRDINALTATELLSFRNRLVAERGMQNVTWNRVSKGLRAALMLAAEDREKVWRKGLESLEDDRPEREQARNVVLTDSEVSRLVLGCYAYDHHFGLLMDVLATTGARSSQAARLLVSDLHLGAKPALSMPRSGKGGGRKRAAKKRKHVTVAITPGLAAGLQEAAKGRRPNDYLLVRSDGVAWQAGAQAHTECRRQMLKVVLEVIDLETNAKGEPVTAYCLRHSSITRMVLANKPLRIIAEKHDTSVKEIEDHYTHGIIDHADALMRDGLLDHSNVIAFPKKAA